jgi:DNA polymerase-3 subunit alpha
MSFVHLRVHSEYSFLRGACRLESLVLRAKELGMPAVALTDYAVLHGAVRFTQLAQKNGIQPILGAEFILEGGLPLVLLVRDGIGWVNLLRLINRFQLTRPKPESVKIEDIARNASGLSAVLHTRGEGLFLTHDNVVPLAESAINALLPYFGTELYLGLESWGHSGEERLNRRLAEALHPRVPLLATHNVHYVLSGDDAIYRMVNCIRTGRPLAGADQSFLPGTSYELKAPVEMLRRFTLYPGAYENTLRIAKRCTFSLNQEGMHLPCFPLPGDELPEAALRRLCLEGMGKFGLQSGEAHRRLERELEVIINKGLASYFLIVYDLVCHARDKGIPTGPGRGSAGGSLVAYLLGITRVDPLAHGLYFERFLSEDREGFPDIDLDVCQRRRDELLDYLRTRYGDGRVAQVSTFSTLGARAAVREVGKVLDLRGEKVSAVAEALPHYAGRGGIDAAIRQFPEFASARLQDDAALAVLEGARKLEGYCRHLSTHASGVILGVRDLAATTPLCVGPSGEILTQWDKDDVETMGFLKIDVLGSRNLTIVHDTLTSVRQRQGSAPEVDDIPLDDEATFELLRKGESLGCFQLESTGMRRVLRRLQPQRLDDLIHLLSLYRPGPWEGGMVEAFINRRQGREEVTYIHPDLAPILSDTFGVILYQEQVMRIACEVGGYTPGAADRLRREMGRRSPVLQEIHLPKFVAGAQARGLSTEEGTAIFETLCRFAGYGFNKAHSAAYALVSYWTAYLKVHHSVEFYAALLSAGFGYYGSAVYVYEAGIRGITILPPHVNKSQATFTTEGNAIRTALPLVRDLGGRGVHAVLESRHSGPYSSITDFCRRVGRTALRRSAVANLIKAGAFDGLGMNRRQGLATLDHVLKWTDRQPGQITLLDWLPDELPLPSLPAYSMAETMAAEAETLGLVLSGHPLTGYADILKPYAPVSLGTLPGLPPGTKATVAVMVLSRSRRRLKQGGVMLTLFICDQGGFAEAIFYPAVYKKLLYRLEGNLFLLRGKTTADGDALLVDDAISLAVLKSQQRGDGTSIVEVTAKT